MLPPGSQPLITRQKAPAGSCSLLHRCLEPFPLSLCISFPECLLALSLSLLLAQFGSHWIYYSLNTANLLLSLLSFIILQVLVTVVTNTRNHLCDIFISTLIVSGLCIISQIHWTFLFYPLACFWFGLNFNKNLTTKEMKLSYIIIP